MSGVEVCESSCISKDPSSPGEDVVAVLEHFLVVVDGVTGKTRESFEGMSGGRFAAETIVAATADLPAEADVEMWVAAVTETLRARIQAASGGGCVAHPPGAQAAVYSLQRREVWRVGDISVRIDGSTPPVTSPPTDRIVTDFRVAYLQARLAAGDTVESLVADDPSRDVIHPLLLMQDVFANNGGHPLGYPVLNGTPVPSRFVEVFGVPPGYWVTFATDGYPHVGASLADSEAELAGLLEVDPLCIGELRGTKGVFPGNRSFDDRAWLRFVAH